MWLKFQGHIFMKHSTYDQIRMQFFHLVTCVVNMKRLLQTYVKYMKAAINWNVDPY